MAPRMGSIVLAAMAVLSLAGNAAAQVETRSQIEIKPLELKLTAALLDELDLQYATGQMALARETAKRILDEARTRAATDKVPDPPAFDTTTNYIIVMWVGTDAKGEMVVRRLLMRPPAGRPYALDLPGVASREADPKLFEVFVAGDPRSTLVSVYTSTREENPLVAQVSSFVEQILGPLFGIVSGVGGELKVTGASRSLSDRTLPNLYVSAYAVRLPFRRASVTVKTLTSVPKTVEMFEKDLAKLRVELQLDGLADNPFAKAYSAGVVTGLVATVGDDVCRKTDASPLACVLALDRHLTDNLEKCTKTRTCVPGATPDADDVKAVKAIHEKCRAFIKALAPKSVSADSAFHNRPPAHLSFGALTGVVLKGEMNKPRAKLDDAGKLAANPMGRLMTMAVLNWTPWGYDADSFDPTAREYVRLFGGAALTPDFGIAGGVSLLIVRGVAVNVGAGWLFSKAVEDEAEFGAAPQDATKPFALGTGKVVFVGVSFNFKAQ